MLKSSTLFVVLGLITLLTLAACGNSTANTGNPAVDAIINYVTTRNTGDAEKLQTLSCKDWEASAQTESDSFKSMSAKVDSLDCQQTGQDGKYTVVTCKGNLTTTYQGLGTTRDLSAKAFRAVNEDNTWKMCGYATK